MNKSLFLHQFDWFNKHDKQSLENKKLLPEDKTVNNVDTKWYGQHSSLGYGKTKLCHNLNHTF